jgi:hypothetical protein
MENILSHGITITQFAAFVFAVLSLVSGVGIAVYTLRAGRQAKIDDDERKKREDEYAEFKKLVFTKFDELYDCVGQDGKAFSELKGAFEMLLKICDKNHG